MVAAAQPDSDHARPAAPNAPPPAGDGFAFHHRRLSDAIASGQLPADIAESLRAILWFALHAQKTSIRALETIKATQAIANLWRENARRAKPLIDSLGADPATRARLSRVYREMIEGN
jgi:hypothetical protein